MIPDNPIEFIKLLKSEHRSIVSTIYDIDGQSRGPSDMQASIEKLNRITDLLFDHLEKEDKQLYPALLDSSSTKELAKKYSYDMERLSCIAVDFFKRYCVNREGRKVFVEDFIDSYSPFKGLITVRIKREEAELYPAFILLQSGALHSEVLDYVKEKEITQKKSANTIVLFGENQVNVEAISLALEISGYKVFSSKNIEEIFPLVQRLQPHVVMLDVSRSGNQVECLIKELKLRNPNRGDLRVVGYSNGSIEKSMEDTQSNLDEFISKPTINIEELSQTIKQLTGY